MIELRNVSKMFHKKNRSVHASRNISLTVGRENIRRYQLVASRKSTLIDCVNILEKPLSGEGYIDGKKITRQSEKELTNERRHIGMIFRHFNLLNSRTVLKNIALPLELARVPKRSFMKGFKICSRRSDRKKKVMIILPIYRVVRNSGLL